LFTMDKFKIDCLVIGGGVAGLAVARSLAISNKKIILIEQQLQIGQETSSRNSEVIHAGIYYPKESLKSKLSLKGKSLLYEYLDQHSVKYNKCGKFIVSASSEGTEKLHQLKVNAENCGVKDLTFSNKDVEDYTFLEFQESLFSPSTGIFDTHSFMNCLRNEYEDYGGLVLLGNKFLGAERFHNFFQVHILDNNTGEEFLLETKKIINCAGLDALRIFNCFQEQDKYKLRLLKGEYYSYLGKEKLNHLIYPVPERDSLGTHATIDLGKGIRFGPSAYEVTEIDYSISEAQKNHFLQSIKSYWPLIKKEYLSPGYSGIRATIEGIDDFTIEIESFDENILVSVLGYVSPGLTASLALGDFIDNSIKEL